MPKHKNKKGRPTLYSDELANDILDRIANGSNIHKITQLEGYPNRTTIYKWLDKNKDFCNNYTRALEDRAHWRSDRLDQICDDLISGAIDDKKARVLIDVQKWQAGKENPQRYGDKIEKTIKGDKESPVAVLSLTPEQMQAINKTFNDEY